ncbi:response regulator [Oscillatoria sp. FACHB-1407]|nr:response regulator [Oscillatoria sp. FACHB-1407]
MLGTHTNISDRKRAEQALQQQAEDLAQANRVKDEFLAVLSHELRSPLNPILGWTKLLQTGNFDPQKTKQALEVIERNAKQQTQLIDDLLDISKILRGKLVLSEAPVDLALIIEAALETVRLSAEAKDIQVKTVLNAYLPPVLGDGGRLQQVVLNLLSNAIKFTSNGGRVEVRLEVGNGEWGMGNGDDPTYTLHPTPYTPHPTPNSPTYAQIVVTDTGKGIVPDFLPYVFDSFRQEDGRTTRKFGGLGLGLAIVRQLTELHGGTVHAESQGEGCGATFTVRLPLMKQAFGTRENPLANPSLQQIQTLQDVRVLVVDDEADMRDLVVTILEQVGAIAHTATSATEALAALNQFQPMIIVSDIGMPDIDGYTLMRRIRSSASEHGRQILAIALTAYASEFDQQLALQAGFQKHLSKPIEPEELIRAIAALVNS